MTSQKKAVADRPFDFRMPESWAFVLLVGAIIVGLGALSKELWYMLGSSLALALLIWALQVGHRREAERQLGAPALGHRPVPAGARHRCVH